MSALAFYGHVQPSEFRQMDVRDAERLNRDLQKLYHAERKEQVDFEVQLLKHEVNALSSLITSLCRQLARLIR